MAQRLQERSGSRKAWLAALVETFEAVAREPAKTCDSATIAALKAKLARPAAAQQVESVH